MADTTRSTRFRNFLDSTQLAVGPDSSPTLNQGDHFLESLAVMEMKIGAGKRQGIGKEYTTKSEACLL
jgi:hypothetical protein